MNFNDRRALDLLPARIAALEARITALNAVLADLDLYRRDPRHNSGLAVGAACAFSLGIAGQVLTFRTRAWLSFAPSTVTSGSRMVNSASSPSASVGAHPSR
jgi:hypothetical protein